MAIITITVFTAMAAAAGQWDAALVLVVAPVPVQQPESMLKEQANIQA
jgi:hypothetical protein